MGVSCGFRVETISYFQTNPMQMSVENLGSGSSSKHVEKIHACEPPSYHLPLMVSNWRLPRPESTLYLDGMYWQTYSWVKNREKKL
jgi:hypothetical protein